MTYRTIAEDALKKEAQKRNTTPTNLKAAGKNILHNLLTMNNKNRIITYIGTGNVVCEGNFSVRKQTGDENLDYLYNENTPNALTLTEKPSYLITILTLLYYNEGTIISRAFEEGSHHPITNLPLKTVTAYILENETILPLPENELYNAFCIDNQTGEPIPQELEVTYAEGPALSV